MFDIEDKDILPLSMEHTFWTWSAQGKVAPIPVKSAIKGWTEVLQLMPVGSKWEVFVPPSLGYGERGAGADIGPNATLVFEIELVDIK